MIIHNLDIFRPRRVFRPFKTDPPLTVDADAVLAPAITAQCLQPVAGQGAQGLKVPRQMQQLQPLVRLPCEALKSLDPRARGKIACPLVPEANDHPGIL